MEFVNCAKHRFLFNDTANKMPIRSSVKAYDYISNVALSFGLRSQFVTLNSSPNHHGTK